MADKRKLNYTSDEYNNLLSNSLTDLSQAKYDMSNKDWAPTYDFDVSDTLYKMKGYEPPQYEGRFDNDVNNAYNRMGRLAGGVYDYASDPAYQAYRKEYLRNGQRATQDTMAAAATMTGGRPSSYAATAAAQAGNNYAAQLSDKIPELYNQAYNRAVQQFQNAQQMQQNDYNRFATERNYDYQRQQDTLNNYLTAWKTSADITSNERDFNYQVQQDRIKNLQNQQSQDWSRYVQQANLALSLGDYGLLRQMGFDTSRTGFASDLQIATILAQYGDFSKLRELMGKG